MKVEKKEKEAIRDVYGEMLVALGEQNPEIVALDADLSGSTRTARFGKRFPERFFNMGIAEQNMVGFAAGLAVAGKIPFVSTFAVFLTGRAWEQIRQEVCHPNLSVKLVASHGGVTVGEDGGSHQCIEDFALMRVLPNMRVVCPSDANEMRSVMEKVVETQGPVFIRMSREGFPILLDDAVEFEFGKAMTVREGMDLTILALGRTLVEALEAADRLERTGIQARVLNMSSLKPIDREALLLAAEETGALITVEEHSVIGGLGSAVAETLMQTKPVPLRILGVPDRKGISGKPEQLMEYYGITAGHIVVAAESILKMKKAALHW
jgi:transketolase